MGNADDFRKQVKIIHRLMALIFLLMIITAGGILLVMNMPISSLSLNEQQIVVIEETTDQNDDFDKIENGIHLRTGLKDGEGLMEVVNNCTNCHSAQLVIQNRMNEERWQATIRWMQETQNLWDLGKNEEIIIKYLVTNYPPTKKGRRSNLQNVEWYELED